MSSVKQPTINIHQIYFDPAQKPGLDPAFIPYDNCLNPHPELREYYVFKEAWSQGMMRHSDYTGLFSWKFYQKTALTGDLFKQFVFENPGYDVYHINPMSHDLLHRNVWTQGERWHPGIIELATKIMHGLGYDVDLAHMRMGGRTMAYCNYWVGSQRFWDSYMQFLNSVFDYINTKLSKEDKAFLSSRADPIIEVGYFPFIIERLFSTYLVMQPQWKVCAYRYRFGQQWRRYISDERDKSRLKQLIKLAALETMGRLKAKN